MQKLKINIQSSFFHQISLGKNSTDAPPSFDAIIIDNVEPFCPFCGKQLENAQCRCNRFTSAFKRFKMKKFGTEELNVRAYEFKIAYAIYFTPDLVEISRLSSSASLPYLDITEASSCFISYKKWLISLATFDNGVLEFYLISEGRDRAFKYRIKLPSFTPTRYQDVEFYRTTTVYKPKRLSAKTLGNY